MIFLNRHFGIASRLFWNLSIFLFKSFKFLSSDKRLINVNVSFIITLNSLTWVWCIHTNFYFSVSLLGAPSVFSAQCIFSGGGRAGGVDKKRKWSKIYVRWRLIKTFYPQLWLCTSGWALRHECRDSLKRHSILFNCQVTPSHDLYTIFDLRPKAKQMILKYFHNEKS